MFGNLLLIDIYQYKTNQCYQKIKIFAQNFTKRFINEVHYVNFFKKTLTNHNTFFTPKDGMWMKRVKMGSIQRFLSL